MELLRDFRATSKAQLRQFCIWYTQGDVRKATELYEYYAAGIELPDTDPLPQGKLQAVKEGVADVLGFVKENQGDIENIVGLARALFGKKPAEAAAAVGALPKIN